MTPPIRVLIVDDHGVVRTGLRVLLATEPGMEVVGEAVDGAEAISQARRLRPDVILLDLVMPRVDGLAAISRITEEDPDARILVLTSFSEDDKIFPAIKAGALGYVLKDSSPHELLDAIRRVYEREPSLSPPIARRVVRELKDAPDSGRAQQSLTDREVQVLALVAKGMSNQEIGERLVISERTVRTHVSSILHKLNLGNRTQAALYALRMGIAGLYSE